MTTTLKKLSVLIAISVLLGAFSFSFTASAAVSVSSGQTYYIHASYSNMFLEPGSSIGSGHYDLSQRYFKVSNNTIQQYQITYLNNGYYSIRNVGLNLYLEVEDASTADQARIILASNSGYERQQWQILAIGNGRFNIYNRVSGKSFTNAGSGAGVDGSRIVQWPYRDYINYTLELVSETLTYNDHRMMNGIGKPTAKYWCVNNAAKAAGFGSMIAVAVDSWKSSITSQPPTSVATSIQNLVKMDDEWSGTILFDYLPLNYDSPDSTTVTLAQTFHYVGVRYIKDPSVEDWECAWIKLNADVISADGKTTSFTVHANTKPLEMRGTCAHELGHAFGLAHSNNNPGRLMCQYLHGCTVYAPTEQDLITTVHLYNY